jgi:hypothetical protein
MFEREIRELATMGNRRVGLIAVAIVASLCVGAVAYSLSLRAAPGGSGKLPSESNARSEACYPGNAPVYPAWVLGNLTTLAQARQTSGTNFSIPAYLPAGITSDEIRIRSNKIVALVFYSSSEEVPILPEYTNVSIIAFIQNNNSSYTFPHVVTQTQTTAITETKGNTTTSSTVTDVITPLLPPAYQNVTISAKYQGWGYEPRNNGPSCFGGWVSWWVNGVNYSVTGYVPLATLIQVADSMTSNQGG